MGIVVYELMKELPYLCEKLEHWTWASHTSASTEVVKGMIGHRPISDVKISDPQLALLFDLELTNLSMVKRYESPGFDFDVLHAHTWEVSLAAVIAKYTKKIPLLYTTHDIMQNDAHDELNETSDIYGHGVLCEKIMMSEADRIIAVSEENRDTLISYYPEVASKTVVIPNGVDTKNFNPEATLPDDIDLQPGYIFFIGRAVPSKGIEAIISMLDHVPDHFHMVFALSTKRWDGEKHPRADYYVKLVNDLQKRRPNTKLIINEWRRDVVAGLYANAAVTLAPSTYEPCGMVTMESQACATPVITNEIGFMKDSVQDGLDGIIIGANPKDPEYPRAMAMAVLSMLENCDLQNEMGKRARCNMDQKHSWRLRAAQHKELYDQLIRGGSQ
ncbi:MAG: glycosyltransferase family 4 protein [Roseobacter sp.]